MQEYDVACRRCWCCDRDMTYTILAQQPFSRPTWVSRCQNVSILDFIGAKDNGGGGDNCLFAWGLTALSAQIGHIVP